MHVIAVAFAVAAAFAPHSAHACSNGVSGYTYTWTIRTATLAACDVPATMIVTPSASVGAPVSATLTVSNPSGATLLVDPLALIATGGAVWSSRPVPDGIVAVPPGGAAGFLWTGTATAAGQIALTSRLTGTRDGWPVAASVAGVGGIASRVTLAVEVSVSNPAPRSGDLFEVRTVVAVSGGADATGLSLTLTMPPEASAVIVESPAPDPAPVAPGQRRTVVWQLRAGRAGPLPLHITATARDGADPLTGTGDATAVVASRFDARCVVFPNPVTGDRLLVGLDLEAPATRVELEVFNAGLDRVYHGMWAGMRPGDELAIDGLARWGSGAYVLKAKSLGAGGDWNAFPPVRFVVAR